MINPNKTYRVNKTGTLTKLHGYLNAFTVTTDDGRKIDGFLDRAVSKPERFTEGTRVRITGVQFYITSDSWGIATMTKLKGI